MPKKPRKRSQSQRVVAKGNNKGRGAKQVATTDPQGSEASENLTVFTENAPWVPTTPQGRLPKTSETASVELPIPPQPERPPPPPVPAKDSAVTMMKTLQDLRKMGMDLSKIQERRLQELESKSKEGSSRRFWDMFFFFLRLPSGQYGPVSQLSRSEEKLYRSI